jgi:acetolactate synthase small subunit
MHITEETSERHVLSITVTNEAGILAKIAGLFTARGYNIESLTVADISDDHQVSRITIVTNGPPRVIDQIIAQLDRLVPVHKVADLTENGPFVERELALVKVAGTGEARIEALRIADITRRSPSSAMAARAMPMRRTCATAASRKSPSRCALAPPRQEGRRPRLQGHGSPRPPPGPTS